MYHFKISSMYCIYIYLSMFGELFVNSCSKLVRLSTIPKQTGDTKICWYVTGTGTVGSRVVKALFPLEVPSLKLTWPLKMVVSNRTCLFQGSIFRGELLVSGRVPPRMLAHHHQDEPFLVG